jgi:hypothetical protein
LNLTKRAETLRLLQKDGYKSRQIIEFSDKEEVINVTHMIVHSKMVNTLWKIHQGNKNIFFTEGKIVYVLYTKVELYGTSLLWCTG